MPNPCTRGIAAQAALEHVDAYRKGAGARVLARVPADSLAAIAACPGTDWIDVEHERWVTHSIFAELGDDAVEYFRWMVARRLIDTPLLRPIVERTTRMFGITPGTYLRFAPLAFGLMFRDFCTLRVAERGQHHGTVELIDCHAEVFANPDYIRSWQGALGSTFDLAHVQGEVSYEVDDRARTIGYLLRW
ncbi:MAG TPA: hypothetical protein VG755_19170 [Nannocystaceae bacterium]|nr:hypothetical protein [Nannocystaceae bacterium]